jgi:hypothetical protein
MSDLHTRALLDMATATRALQMEIIALRAQVEALRKPSTLERIATLIQSTTSFLQTPLGKCLSGAAIGVGNLILWWISGHR